VIADLSVYLVSVLLSVTISACLFLSGKRVRVLLLCFFGLFSFACWRSIDLERSIDKPSLKVTVSVGF
jgi:hypothetical protein